ncbi:MAG: hypothetical protein BMS9Abin28_1158 [Anaerolineae bacterium]|nr:MAG: hypothetical protein BMS9Abin28_1158 [Anaerolineae bacterium]
MTHRYRISYGKAPELRFTGHLDLNRAWERTIRRAEISLAYGADALFDLFLSPFAHYLARIRLCA